MGYRYLEQMTEAYNILLLKNTADFKKAIENLSENKVVLAHGFCTRCQQISYYVSDCNQGIRSHICSECGGRFFVNGYKGYIAMEDLNGSAIEENIKITKKLGKKISSPEYPDNKKPKIPPKTNKEAPIKYGKNCGLPSHNTFSFESKTLFSSCTIYQL